MIFPSPIKFTWLLSLIFHFTFGMGTVSWIIFDMMELLQGYFFPVLKRVDDGRWSNADEMGRWLVGHSHSRTPRSRSRSGSYHRRADRSRCSACVAAPSAWQWPHPSAGGQAWRRRMRLWTSASAPPCAGSPRDWSAAPARRRIRECTHPGASGCC